jgi:hypothetical protein
MEIPFQAHMSLLRELTNWTFMGLHIVDNSPFKTGPSPAQGTYLSSPSPRAMAGSWEDTAGSAAAVAPNPPSRYNTPPLALSPPRLPTSLAIASLKPQP